jgi:hypothetical protein
MKGKRKLAGFADVEYTSSINKNTQGENRLE